MKKINYCLCCNKPLLEDSSGYWHHKCIKDFFGVDNLPEINLKDLDIDLNNRASEMVDKKENITGVQKKLSFGLLKKENRLTVTNYPVNYILKPETASELNYARGEHLVMSMADLAGIKTAKHALVLINDEHYAYITKRFDRKGRKKIHMEDFCQLSNQITDDKYHGSYEGCGRVIKKYSSYPIKELTDFYYLILFCYITCNSDMHLKNFSLIEDDIIYMSPSYDLLPVNIVYPKDLEEVALTLNGKKSNITRKDFIKFGFNLGLDKVVITRNINLICSYKNVFIEMINKSLLDNEYKDRFVKEIKRRIGVLTPEKV